MGCGIFRGPFPVRDTGVPRGLSAYAIIGLTRSKALIINLIRQVTVGHGTPKSHRSRCTATG